MHTCVRTHASITRGCVGQALGIWEDMLALGIPEGDVYADSDNWRDDEGRSRSACIFVFRKSYGVRARATLQSAGRLEAWLAGWLPG